MVRMIEKYVRRVSVTYEFDVEFSADSEIGSSTASAIAESMACSCLDRQAIDRLYPQAEGESDFEDEDGSGHAAFTDLSFERPNIVEVSVQRIGPR